MLSYVAASRQTMTAAPHPMSLWGSATDCQGRRAQGQGRGTFPLVHFLWVTKVFVTCTTQAGNIHWKGEHTHTSLSLSLSLSLSFTHTHTFTRTYTHVHTFTHTDGAGPGTPASPMPPLPPASPYGYVGSLNAGGFLVVLQLVPTSC
jgi:hypothetical protein